ncbi:hypothetical protein P1S61_13125 [Streptomyces sp. ME08-AFT2]|uniref:CATRA system-associated protein n=1 Tax=Streptomyces sp. ME08-AFT2 TaxID=3028683 RepID=UPI0029B437CA|nr:CATRA system-associated protein [Streptomyces sp. ME08-AFT2]MDX3310014.1 hypothetical protein [Streptomyces sp. ME08-AFT2]
MSTSKGPAAIDRNAAEPALLVLRLMRDEWRLPPQGWEEITELLDELSAAVAAGDTAAVDALTGELEVFSGSRVSRIGRSPDGTPPQDDGKVPLPEPERERVVALVHALAPDSPPGGPRPAPAERI